MKPRPGCSAVYMMMVINVYMLVVSNIFYNMVSFTVPRCRAPFSPAVHSVSALNTSLALSFSCSGLSINSPIFSYYVLAPFFRRPDVLALIVCRPSVQTFFTRRPSERRRSAVETCTITRACPAGTDFRFTIASKSFTGSITRLLSAGRTIDSRGFSPAYTITRTLSRRSRCSGDRGLIPADRTADARGFALAYTAARTFR
jgi:hypothetical protein